MANIVVVDDDPAMRTMVAELLGDAGHVVRQAIDGEHALAVIVGQPPDLVLSDIAMPALDGMELARTLADQAPTTPVLLMSGSCPRRLMSPAPCLPKPFAPERLLALIDDLLVA